MRTRKQPAGAVEVRGTLRLNAPFSFGIREISPLIAGFLRSHPALNIDLGLNDRQVDLIEEGWDLAVRIGDMADSSLIARRLAPCHTAVCAAPRYLSEKGTPRTVSDLTGHNCLGYTLSRALGTSSWQFGSDRKTNAPVSGSLKANNGDALVAAAVAGEGIVYQPTFLVAREIAAGLLVPIELDTAADFRGRHFCHLSRQSPPACKGPGFHRFPCEKLRPRARMGPHLRAAHTSPGTPRGKF